MERGNDPFLREKENAYAMKNARESLEIPKGFYQRPDGIISPERLRNPEPRITINGLVDQEMFKNVSTNLQKITETNGVIEGLQVNFSSFGGEITSGFGVHDLLKVFGREHDAAVTITGYGPIMSMGVLILQAGDIRRMPSNSRMLLHPTSTRISGDIGRAEFHIEEARALYTMYTEIISERVRNAGKEMTPEDVSNLMQANAGVGTHLTSEQALEFGLIDEIV